MLPLAINAEMSFPNLPFLDRVRTIHELGFRVGLWGLDHLDLDKLAATGAVFSMCDGFGGGNLVEPDAAEKMIASIEAMIPRVIDLGSPIMNLHGAKLGSNGAALNPVPNINGAMWLCARDTLCRIAEIGEAKGINFTVENLNPFDHPGVPLHKAMDILALVQAVNSPRITLNLDLYHAQKDGGNLINLLRTCHGFVGEVQIADVPLRDVPGGGGEVHYGNIALAMKDIGYTCSVGLEAYAPGDSKADLDRFKAIFAHFHGAR